MILLVECVICCVLFTVLVMRAVYRDPIKVKNFSNLFQTLVSI